MAGKMPWMPHSSVRVQEGHLEENGALISDLFRFGNEIFAAQKKPGAASRLLELRLGDRAGPSYS
jgi:hypothetical protein